MARRPLLSGVPYNFPCKVICSPARSSRQNPSTAPAPAQASASSNFPIDPSHRAFPPGSVCSVAVPPGPSKTTKPTDEPLCSRSPAFFRASARAPDPVRPIQTAGIGRAEASSAVWSQGGPGRGRLINQGSQSQPSPAQWRGLDRFIKAPPPPALPTVPTSSCHTRHSLDLHPKRRAEACSQLRGQTATVQPAREKGIASSRSLPHFHRRFFHPAFTASIDPWHSRLSTRVLSPAASRTTAVFIQLSVCSRWRCAPRSCCTARHLVAAPIPTRGTVSLQLALLRPYCRRSQPCSG